MRGNLFLQGMWAESSINLHLSQNSIFFIIAVSKHHNKYGKIVVSSAGLRRDHLRHRPASLPSLYTIQPLGGTHEPESGSSCFYLKTPSHSEKRPRKKGLLTGILKTECFCCVCERLNWPRNVRAAPKRPAVLGWDVSTALEGFTVGCPEACVCRLFLQVFPALAGWGRWEASWVALIVCPWSGNLWSRDNFSRWEIFKLQAWSSLTNT